MCCAIQYKVYGVKYINPVSLARVQAAMFGGETPADLYTTGEEGAIPYNDGQLN